MGIGNHFFEWIDGSALLAILEVPVHHVLCSDVAAVPCQFGVGILCKLAGCVFLEPVFFDAGIVARVIRVIVNVGQVVIIKAILCPDQGDH